MPLKSVFFEALMLLPEILHAMFKSACMLLALRSTGLTC